MVTHSDRILIDKLEIDAPTMSLLSSLEDRIGYIFANKSLLLRAVTHASYGDGRRQITDNERLEFLGDRVLGLLTAETLYDAGHLKEGLMARKLNALVRKEMCASVAEEISLGDAMRMSRSEHKQGGRARISILGDACEALLGAIYLDGGLEAAQAFYNNHWAPHVALIMGRSAKDPKTELQERASKRGLTIPEYITLERTGPDHKPHFKVRVSVGDKEYAEGEGPSKKVAEREAAQALLDEWKIVL